MAKANVSEYDVVAANNTDISSINITGTGLVSTADDSFRANSANLAKWWSDIGGVNTVAGTADAITVTTPTVYGALKTGMRFNFKASAANTGAATLNFDALGAKAVRKISGGTDVALSAGDIPGAGARIDVIYDATANSAAGAWVLVNYVDSAPGALPYPTGHLSGLTLSNNASDATNDIDIATGTARDGSDAVNMVLASALTKRLDAAWAVGTGNGGLDTGSIANATYYVWLIKRSDTGVVDALFSTSATAPTMPSNYDYKRRIGTIIRSGATILPFVQRGRQFALKTPLKDQDTTIGTTAANISVSVPAVSGVIAKILVQGSTGNTGAVYVYSKLTTDAAISATYNSSPSDIATAVVARQWKEVLTDDAQLRVVGSAASQAYAVYTEGWIDPLGGAA